MALNWLSIGITLAALLAFGSAYAFFVRWLSERGVEGQTAYLVAFGVGMTVALVAPLVGLANALIVLAGFVASGIPMIVEYVARISGEHKRDRDEAAKHARELLK